MATSELNKPEEDQQTEGFLGRYNIVIQLFVLVVMLSSLAYYNYTTQKNVLEQQLEVDTENIVQAMRASINKFGAINKTLSLQDLVRDISLRLDIFEFRYLNKEGVIINSMFKEEIGKNFERPGFDLDKITLSEKGKFYTDERDYTSVLAISQPVFVDGELAGVLDVAVDISEFQYLKADQKKTVMRQIEVHIENMLNVMAVSIANNLTVFNTMDYDSFLTNYVKETLNIMQVTITDEDGVVVASSNDKQRNNQLEISNKQSRALINENDKPVYRVLAHLDPNLQGGEQLLLMIDAELYVANEKRLLLTALATSFLIIIFSMIITYSIYRINLDRGRKEKIRLKKMVKERTREIERLSQIDKLTGLSNRRHLEEIMVSEYRRAIRFSHDLSIVMVDLDHFKRVNDDYGHLAGDEVLRVTGKILLDTLRDTDFAGRYGGEEFVVLLPESGTQAALDVAEKLRKAIADLHIEFEGKVIPVTASLGLSISKENIADVNEVLKQADEALYHSKENGRNRVTSYEMLSAA